MKNRLVVDGTSQGFWNYGLGMSLISNNVLCTWHCTDGLPHVLPLAVHLDMGHLPEGVECSGKIFYFFNGMMAQMASSNPVNL